MIAPGTLCKLAAALTLTTTTLLLPACDDPGSQEQAGAVQTPAALPSPLLAPPTPTAPPMAYVPPVQQAPPNFYQEGTWANDVPLPPPGDADADGELDYGSYAATVENTTESYGPYSLDVDVGAGDVTIHFENGGYIVTDIDSQDWNGMEWTLDTTESSSGDQWTVTVTP
jgi:hypothetical protein